MPSTWVRRLRMGIRSVLPWHAWQQQRRGCEVPPRHGFAATHDSTCGSSTLRRIIDASVEQPACGARERAAVRPPLAVAVLLALRTDGEDSGGHADPHLRTCARRAR